MTGVFVKKKKKERKKEICTQTGTEGRPCEDIRKRWPSTSEGDKPLKIPPLILDFRLPELLSKPPSVWSFVPAALAG